MAVDVETPKSTTTTASETHKPHHAFDGVGAGGGEEEEEEVNDTPIEQVRLTVPPTDNPNLPVLTFRAWFLGIMACALLAFLNQFFGYRENGLAVSAVAAQIVTLPLGKLMAATLPTKEFSIPFLFNWKFSLNPGPFNVKEHVLITIFANSGSNGAYALSIVTIMKAFYHRGMNPVAAFLLVQTTMLLGYGWAGMYRKILVDSPYMWWPGNMINISLFRTLHDDEKRQKGGLTRLQFFLAAFTASFAYYVFPAYFIPSISTISIGCIIWKKSVLAQQLTSGLHGLGIGAFSLDWNAVVSFLGNPLGIPSFAIINTMVGFIVVLYIVIPAVHWTNTYDAKKFPLISSHVFDSTGQRYNTTRVLNQKSFDLNAPAYDSYSKLYMSTTFAMNYGFSFATLTAAISHVMLFYGRSIMRHWSQTTALREKDGDVHTRLMKKNYAPVPNWWFHSILAAVFALSLLTCEGFGKQIQLPWWGLILACAIAFFFTLPIGIIQAITNQAIGLNVITELVIGYLYPGKPLANVTFKTYGYISMTQALYFLGDFKLGHYMKIPPKSMFVVQLAGTLVACSVQFATAWWLLTTVDNICTPSLLPMGSPWTCPGDDVFYNASIIWGVIGPKRMFTRLGVYPELNWFFLIGFLAPVPVWYLSRKYPDKHWIKLINMPLIFGATSNMPPARAVNYWMWGGVGLFFSHYMYRQHKQWWAKHAYILGAALDAGIAFMAILLYITLQGKGIFGPNWWGLDNDDHCPLASCPTAPGIAVDGCPVY